MPGASHNIFNSLATHFSPCTMFLLKMPVGELCFEELRDRMLFVSKSFNFCEQQAALDRLRSLRTCSASFQCLLAVSYRHEVIKLTDRACVHQVAATPYLFLFSPHFFLIIAVLHP